MSSRPMISASVTIGLIQAIKDTGIDPRKVFESLDLGPAVFSRAEGFIPCSTFARALERMVELTGDCSFGLRFGARSNPKNIGALAYAVLNSSTVADAFETGARYIHLHNEAAQVVFRQEKNLDYLCYSLKHLDFDDPRQFIEYGMAAALNTLRVMVGSQWSPREVHFAHKAPRDASAHREIFRAPIIFECAATAFVMDREFCVQSVPAADANLAKILNHYLETVLSQVPKEDQCLAYIRRQIGESIKSGNPTLAHVAKTLGRSRRTLQRQLSERDIDFRDLVADTRRRFALDYLRDPENTLTEIAFLLGYSEVSAFNRSFKRWSGKTPLQYRRLLVQKNL